MAECHSILYDAANKSLDLTIDALGRELFDQNLNRFIHALLVVEQTCLPKVVFPCDANGTRHQETDCIQYDSGCG
jgi:hypothetical protein